MRRGTARGGGKRRRWIILTAVLAALGALACAALYRDLVVRRYALTDRRASGVRFVLVSDLHAAQYCEGQGDILRLIARQSPDIILLAWDMLSDQHDNAATMRFMEGAAGIAPCYYVTGSHDLWTPGAGALLDAIQDYGVTLLAGEEARVEARGRALAIGGMGDPTYGGAAGDDRPRYLAEMRRAFAQLSQDTFNVLVAHRLDYIDEYLQYDFDMIVYGHTHGGQARVPLLLNGLYAPDQGWFPPYAGGLYTVEGRALIVSRGLSYYPRLPRVFNPPEVCVIDIL